MTIDFIHKPAAHCENGVISNLLRYYGLELSEPMIFGIGSGYFFSHMPFYKLHGMPVTSFRVLPGVIFNRLARRLGIRLERSRFRDPEKAMEELDRLVDKGIPVGLLVGVFHLPYFPREYRFHFNAHNITVIGREGDRYLISDPVMENVEYLTRSELIRVRFARGTYPPRGRMYHLTHVPLQADLKQAIIKGIRKTATDMLTIPLPMFGIRGIRYLAGRLRRWPEKLGPEDAALHLSQVVRMLEEIGTGGAGFRFIYAAFLQECAAYINKPWLNDISREMTAVGDKWREFAVLASRVFKNRGNGDVTYDSLSALLNDIADMEENVFLQLRYISL